MNGLIPTYQIVTQAQLEERMRRAAEYRLAREARQHRPSLGLIWKLFGRLALSDGMNAEPAGAGTPQTAQ